MEPRWGGLLIDFFRPAVFRQLMGWSLYITAFGLVLEVPVTLDFKVLLVLCLLLGMNLPRTKVFPRRGLIGRLVQLSIYYGTFLLLQKDLISPPTLPLLALSAYSLIPFKVSGFLASVTLSPVALSEARKWKAINRMTFLALGCFLVITPHFLGVTDLVGETLAAVLFISAFTIYLEKIQRNLVLTDFLSHFLLMGYFMVPAILSLIFSHYV